MPQIRMLGLNRQDAYCTACQADVLVLPDLACPQCGQKVHPLSLAVVPEAEARPTVLLATQAGVTPSQTPNAIPAEVVKPAATPKPETAAPARAAVLPRIKAAVQLDSSLDAVVAALQAEEDAARAAYEESRERYRIARKAASDARQLRALVKVEELPPGKPSAPTAPADGSKPWSRQYAACTNCGTTDSPHQGHGLCGACAQYQRKNGRPRPVGPIS